MSARLIATVALAAGAYVLWQRQSETVQMVAVQPVSLPSPEPKNDYTPLISWGVDTAVNLLSSNKTGGQSGGWGNIFKRRSSEPSAPAATPRQKSNTQGVNGLLQLIGGIEAPQGYDQVYGGSKINPPRPITTMTVDEVLAWQDRSVAAGSASSAAGRYQIIRKTLRGLKSGGHVRGSEIFSAATQDRLAVVLMERRGLSKYQNGQISQETFANNLAKEWASLPVVSGSKRGRSYYGGDGLNKALTGVENVLSRLEVL